MFHDETGRGQSQGPDPRYLKHRHALRIGLSLGLLGLAALSARAEELKVPATAEAPVAINASLEASATTVGHFTVDLRVDHDEQVSLLDWVKHRAEIQPPKEKYNRRLQFGKWRPLGYDGSCLNARGLVLERESKVRVATRANSIGCTVVSGRWVDPYNGEVHEAADEMAIDHLVPLKNAYDNGAWKWSANKRCLYFNSQKNNYHLQAVGARENAVKGDSGPDRYMPPLRSRQCTYLREWLMVKATWDLAIPVDEGEAIIENARQAGCKDAELEVSLEELRQEREKVRDSAETCSFGANSSEQVTPQAAVPTIPAPPEFVDAGAGI